jgi:DtxR family transcriptional regulator, Mn-dependent transcriptional regulator
MRSDEADEILETLWVESEGEPPAVLSALAENPAFKELCLLGLASVAGERAVLTDRGRREAESAVRRHRLAERLMADVLHVDESSLNAASCRVEHVLHAGIEDKVCRLLGHPRVCPHGKPIPRGACCSQGLRPGDKLVAPLADLDPGEEGRVSYLYAEDPTRIQELVAIGVLPGASVKLIRKFPAYVFSLGESEFAVDEPMARAIYVRIHE